MMEPFGNSGGTLITVPKSAVAVRVAISVPNNAQPIKVDIDPATRKE
jgi:hypothetical protein